MADQSALELVAVGELTESVRGSDIMLSRGAFMVVGIGAGAGMARVFRFELASTTGAAPGALYLVSDEGLRV